MQLTKPELSNKFRNMWLYPKKDNGFDDIAEYCLELQLINSELLEACKRAVECEERNGVLSVGAFQDLQQAILKAEKGI